MVLVVDLYRSKPFGRGRRPFTAAPAPAGRALPYRYRRWYLRIMYSILSST